MAINGISYTLGPFVRHATQMHGRDIATGRLGLTSSWLPCDHTATYPLESGLWQEVQQTTIVDGQSHTVSPPLRAAAVVNLIIYILAHDPPHRRFGCDSQLL